MTASMRNTVGLLVLIFATACGESSQLGSPAAPTPAPGSSRLGTAIISGTVNGTSSISTQLAATTGGLTITVVGTNLIAATDAAGRFTLQGVPSGDVQLRFTAPGVDATITISGVQDGEHIQIVVRVSGSSAVIESQGHGPNNKVELEGRISDLNAAARTFRVDGAFVHVPMDTIIRHGSRLFQFSDLMNGDRVHVRGTRVGETVEAQQIKLQNPGGPGPNNVELEGTVQGLTGSCPSGLQFMLNGTIVLTGPSTAFTEGPCSDVENGIEVEVEGTRQPDGNVLASQVEIEDEPNNEVDLEGVVRNLTGSCATGLQFTLNGTSVMTNATTRFKDGACSDIENGVEVEVEGTRQADGKVLALSIEVDD